MTIEDSIVGPEVAHEWVREARDLRMRTRLMRQGFWLPLVLLGLVIVAATPLYFRPSDAARLGLPAATVFKARPASTPLAPAQPHQAQMCAGNVCVALPMCVAVHGVVYTPCFSTTSSPRDAAFFPGGVFTASPRAIATYWLVTLPIAYLLTAWWYSSRARRNGVSTSPVAYVLAGIGLLALLVVTSRGTIDLLHLPGLLSVIGTGDLSIRGLTPLVTISLGLFVLSYIERSRTLAAFSGAFLTLALVVNLYDLENLAARLGYQIGPEIGVFVAGVVMLAGGIAFGFARRHAT